MATRRRATKPEQAQEAADWPTGMPYTLYFPTRGGFAAADMEYSAPLPRVGDLVEYIDPEGNSRWYTVSDVVHTFQDRKPVAPEGMRLLRAGLPAVYLARSRRKAPRRAP
ncbi:MAG: hypothetical protein ACRDFZ_04475 [Candidatus Limnocylindria bacterium]